MPTIISGPVLLPDGSNPQHGRVLFTARRVRLAAPIILPGPVAAPIVNGQVSISLHGEAAGLPYAVAVEYFARPHYKPVVARLPDVVIPIDGTGTLASLAAVDIPEGATNVHVIDQGESLNVGMQYLDDNRRPASIADITISSWLGREGEGRIGLALTKINSAQGTFEISRDAALTVELSGAYQWAVRMSAGARVKIKTGTLIVNKVVR